jgi:diguanylate cyclase (GGDEF)-like protein
VETDGGWRGEIWSRRKDGGAYPELRSITTVQNEFGETTRYVVIFYDLTEVKRSEALEEELIYKAGHDPLTDLPNRTLFYDRLSRDIARAKRNGTSLAVMLVGIDSFKQVNETLGHMVGDKLLKLASERIKRSNREMDTIARFGGDEFGVIFENIGNAENAGKAARKIMNAFAAPFILDEGEIFLTISMGVALYPNDDGTVEILIKNCDTAMHRAKDAGKNSCEFFRPEMTEKAMKRHTIERELRLAVEKKEFIPYFQPKVHLKTGEMTSMETLARWNHPLLGIVPPNDFIPIAEETGLVTDIGGFMLKEACRINKQWANTGYPPLRVAVNLSARQFQRGNIVAEVQKALEETSLAPEYLELEITESMVMQDVEQAIKTLQALHDMGIVLSVDDFGTGYSSLGYLKRFPLDALKIDVIFIRDMVTSEEDQEIVAAIISMAHNLKLKVIAEGVETAAHIEFLEELGCDEIQGFYYSKPLPSKDFEELMRKGRILKPAGYLPNLNSTSPTK